MPGGEPKPKDPEIIAGEKVCEEIRVMAKTIPHPPSISKEERALEQFGNNFWILFWAYGHEKSGIDLMGSERPPLEKAKEYGEKWERFIKENAILIDEIKKTLKNIVLYRELHRKFTDLLKNPKTLGMAIRMDEEVNIESIKVEVWKKLNPFLKQAAEAMRQHGINPEDFYV